jgi:hypothetical protein
MMEKETFIVVLLYPFCIAPPAYSQHTVTIPCEIMEVSEPFESSYAKLNGIRYILLHHAHSEDRETLSRWLKANSGTEVTFIIQFEFPVACSAG